MTQEFALVMVVALIQIHAHADLDLQVLIAVRFYATEFINLLPLFAADKVHV